MKLTVDLNADLGEGSGHDAELFELISSANIATGFHAGNSDTMHESISAAKKHGVAIGAHPSLWDRENFGRKELKVVEQEVFDAVAYQLGIFQAIASALGMQPNHVKPHGALYNMAVRDAELANAITRAIASVDARLILFAPEKSELARAGTAQGLQIAPEIFADRNYLNDGWLVPARDPMRCSTIQKKPPNVSCGCCAKARCARSKVAMSRCAAKRFVSTAIHPAPSASPANCEHNSNVKGSKSARRKVRSDKSIVILSEAKNLRSHLPMNRC